MLLYKNLILNIFLCILHKKMFPAHINPDPYYKIITEYLSGYDICCLNFVNQELNDYCCDNNLIDKTEDIFGGDLVKEFKNNDCKPVNAIFITRPICSTRYPRPDEISEDDEKMLNIGEYCRGTIFKDNNDGKNLCEECMTKKYGSKWKDWEKLPRIAKDTRYFIKIEEIEVEQEYFEIEDPSDGWKSSVYKLKEDKMISHLRFWDDCLIRTVAYNLIFKGGRMRISFYDVHDEYAQFGPDERHLEPKYFPPSLFLNKYECEIDDLVVLV